MMCCLLGAAWSDVGLEFDDCTLLARKHLSAWSDFRRRASSERCVEVRTVGICWFRQGISEHVS